MSAKLAVRVSFKKDTHNRNGLPHPFGKKNQEFSLFLRHGIKQLRSDSLGMVTI